jgi:DNA end-binding protein Ku
MRYIWKGSINFALINIPVGLITAAKDRDLKFVLLHKKDLSEIRYARICKKEDKEIPYQEIVKGIEIDGQYKVLSIDEIKEIEGEESNQIEILTFCDADEVDTIYFEKPYFLEPQKGGEKAYVLLRNALLKTNKVAIANFVFKNHFHIAVIKPYENLLVLNRLRYKSQIVDPSKIHVPEAKISASEILLAEKIIKELNGHFKPEKYHDQYLEVMKNALKKKKGTKIHKEQEKTSGATVYDIVGLLKKSLEKPTRKKRAK